MRGLGWLWRKMRFDGGGGEPSRDARCQAGGAGFGLGTSSQPRTGGRRGDGCGLEELPPEACSWLSRRRHWPASSFPSPTHPPTHPLGNQVGVDCSEMPRNPDAPGPPPAGPEPADRGLLASTLLTGEPPRGCGRGDGPVVGRRPLGVSMKGRLFSLVGPRGRNPGSFPSDARR